MTRTGFVEEALLGALLNDPRLIADVPWLNASDFTDPLCHALWTELSRRPAPDPAPDAGQLAERLAATTELHRNHRSASAIAQLQLQAPFKPAVVAYARILLEATTRREILALGWRLTQVDPAQPEQGLRHIAEISRALQQARQPTHDADGRPHPAETAHHPQPDGHLGLGANGVQASRCSAATPRLSGHHEDMHQDLAHAAVLGAAIHDSPAGSRGHVLATVRPDDLTDPALRSAWTAVTDLHQAGQPIDEITVYWQLTHTAAAGQPIPTLTQLRETRNAAILHEQAAQLLATSAAARLTARLPTLLARLEANDTLDAAALTESVSANATAIRSTLQRLVGTPDQAQAERAATAVRAPVRAPSGPRPVGSHQPHEAFTLGQRVGPDHLLA